MTTARDSSYSVSVSPFKKTILGLPVGTFAATCAATLLYFISFLIILSTSCPFNKNVICLFAFICLAIITTLAMAILNIYYNRYRFNCLSLTVSLFYSGSAFLIAYSLIMATIEGLCLPASAPKSSIFVSGGVADYFVWFLTAFALAFQIVAHYFYG